MPSDRCVILLLAFSAFVVITGACSSETLEQTASEPDEGLAEQSFLLTEEEAGYAGAQRALVEACPTGSGEFEEASIDALGSVAHGIRPTSEIPADLLGAIAREKPNWSGVFDTWVFGETQVTLVAHAGIQIDGRSFAAGAVTLGFYERENGERFWAVPESGLMYDC